MSDIVKIIFSLIIGALIGFVTAIDAISTGWGVTPLNNHLWTYYDNLASKESHVYARAFFKNNKHLPLPSEHALYFFRSLDDNGEKLQNHCRYKLSSDKIDTNFWSISAYDQDRNLIANPSKRHSFNKSNIIRNNNGSFDINFASEIQTGNWLPIIQNNDGKLDHFIVSLRLYGLDKDLVSNIAEIKLPNIEKVGCH